MSLTFWTHPMSRGQIVHWMLEELGEPYDTVWLEWGAQPGGHKHPDFLAVNPMGKVPAVRHDGAVVTEAAAICLYLADAFPKAGLKPDGDALADYYRWTLFCSGPVEQAVTARAMGWTVPPDREGTVGFGTYDAAVEALSGHLAGRRFVAGDAFSAADVYVGATVDWGLSFGTLPSLPALEAYAQGLRARPAYRRFKAVVAEKMPKA